MTDKTKRNLSRRSLKWLSLAPGVFVLQAAGCMLDQTLISDLLNTAISLLIDSVFATTVI